MSHPIDRIRRMRERFHTRIEGAVALTMRFGERVEHGLTKNLSLGGTLIVTDAKIQAGETLELELTRGEVRVTCQARAASVAEEGVGLAFLEPGPDFRRIVEVLIAELRAADAEARAHDHVSADVAWSRLPDGSRWAWWKKRRYDAKLFSLTEQGAAIVAIKKPEVGATVLLYFDTVNCRAEVVRHTDRGFAVRFIEPSAELLQLVTRLRSPAP